LNKHTKYLLTLVLIIVFLDILFISYNVNLIEVYLLAYIIVYFLVSEIYSPRRKYFDYLGLSLFIIFVYIVVIYIIKALFLV